MEEKEIILKGAKLWTGGAVGLIQGGSVYDAQLRSNSGCPAGMVRRCEMCPALYVFACDELLSARCLRCRWERLDESEEWQLGAYGGLTAAYSVIAIVALVR